MSTISREAVSKLRKSFCDVNQGHVFTWWDELSSKEREVLLRQLTSIDVDRLQQLISENLTQKSRKKERTFEPLQIVTLPDTDEERNFREKARDVGETVIRNGRCAAFVAAGSGDSDRCIDGLKGKFPITPVTGKSLFQFHTEKVLALRCKYGVNIPLFVMTSADNHQETSDFFEENDYFGLSGEDIFFFTQGMLPVVDTSGKLLMKTTSQLYMSPDGHGGAIRSLYNSGALEEMERRGIEYIFYFQVDNPLTKILDTVFLGYHHLAGAEISSKVVRKRSPEERVGVLGTVNGSPGVVEYTDLSKEEMYARDGQGELKFFAGNIATHILNVDFIRRLSTGKFKTDYHPSEKSYDSINAKGEIVQPTNSNAVKFESFVFDALQYAKSTVTLEVSREEEFSPFKTLDGEDNPKACRQMISRFYKSWLERADFKVADDDVQVEISPLFALDEDEFRRKVMEQDQILSKKLYIE